MTIIKKMLFLCVIAIIAVCTIACASSSNDEFGTPELVEGVDYAPAGFYESNANPALAAVVELNKKLAPKDDEVIIYYVRKDKNYEPWALWIWAVKGGDGSSMWDKSQEWKVENDIGYMKFKKSPAIIDADGNMGLIVRQDEGWTKDGDGDRTVDTKINNAVVVFSGDADTYAVGEFKMKITSAVLTTETRILLTLNAKYGLDTAEGADSGFVVREKAASPDGGKVYPIAKVSNTFAPTISEANYTKTVALDLSEPVTSFNIEVFHPDFEGARSVDASQFAWKFAEKTIPSKDEGLGLVYSASSKTASFKVWAPTSSKVSVLLYKRGTASRPDATIPMTLDSKTGVWSAVYKENDIDGWFYEYEITNSRGTNKTLDPYARSMAAYENTGDSGRAAVVDMKSAKANPAGGWEGYTGITLEKRGDAVIYEVSVRDITISPDANVKSEPGTYTAFIEKLPYLKSLGVTHLQILPVQNFYYTDELNKSYEDAGKTSDSNYNWGYDPHNYFSPEGWYSSNPSDPYARIAELKTLIKEAHKNGLGILLDVVYNHMAKTDLMEDIVPGYYFRTNAKGQFTSNSGCGNDVATEREMARKLIVDSTRYWVDEYKVDGFRFDLMGLIDSETVLASYGETSKIKPNVLYVGEGWKMYNGPSGTVGMDQNFMSKTNSVAVFNDELRDLVKAGGMSEAGQGFITGKAVSPEQLFKNSIGQPQKNYTADSPSDNVQYLVCHDGLTLHDSIVFNAKLDEKTPAGKAEIIRRLQMGNFIGLTSQGIAFLHAGQERGRSKPAYNAKNETVGQFVRNSYDSSDTINQIVWTLDADYQKLLDYTKGLIAIRKAYPEFRFADKKTIDANITFLPQASGDFLLSYKIAGNGYNLYVVLNSGSKAANVTIPIGSVEVLSDANVAQTTAIANPAGVTITGTNVMLDPLTAVLLKEKK